MKENEKDSNKNGINDEMESLEIAGNIAKGSWILGKRMLSAAKDALEQKMSEVNEHKENYGEKTDDELFNILDTYKDNKGNSKFIGAVKLLQERGYDVEEIKAIIDNR